MRGDLKLRERIPVRSARSRWLSQKTRVPWIDYQDPISHKERWGFVVLGESLLSSRLYKNRRTSEYVKFFLHLTLVALFNKGCFIFHTSSLSLDVNIVIRYYNFNDKIILWQRD